MQNARPTTVPVAPAWQVYADQLRAALSSAPPQERRRILEYICSPPAPPALSEVRTYSIADCKRASLRVTELLARHPRWTQAHARRDVARELGVSTGQLRRMLRRYQA